jgi:hypothetical protein
MIASKMKDMWWPKLHRWVEPTKKKMQC